jgi:hypothetical protein
MIASEAHAVAAILNKVLGQRTAWQLLSLPLPQASNHLLAMNPTDSGDDAHSVGNGVAVGPRFISCSI